eukprot:PITA_18342
MEKEANVGMAKVVATSKKNKNDDPLPFLRKSSNKFPFESFGGVQAAKRKVVALGPMDKILQKEKWEELDLTVAFFFYQNFISFNVARSPLFIEMCRSLTQGAPSGYVPSGSEKLRTTLLTKAKKEVDKMLEPIKSAWPTSGLSIVFDGWTNPTHHPLINFMIMHLFARALGMIVDAKYPQVFWTLCIVHSSNLALKTIASDVLWIGSIVEDAQHICNFVQNHTNALTIYKEYTNLSLLKIADTWFASSFIMLKRLREIKTALGAMVISEFWSFSRKTNQAASKRVKDTVLDDAWWERIDLLIKIMDPIISLLRFADTNQPILGEVYEGWDSVIESMRRFILQSECPKYETSSEAFFTTIQDIFVSGWNKNCTPLHCLAHSLNPKYYSHEWLNGGPSHRTSSHGW